MKGWRLWFNEPTHTDHLVQLAALGLREAGHMDGEAGVV